jgi:hypothetical protein
MVADLSAKRWTLAAVAALFAAWTVAPSSLPIYDGPLQPDEPYRYVAPPPGYRQTPPPTTATATLKVMNGRNVGGYANSAETGPQVVVYIPPGALSFPGGTANITVTATPVAPSPPLPKDGTISTNIYRIAATAPAGPVTIVGKGNQEPVMLLRAPSGKQPGPKFEHRVGNGWQLITKTARYGNDIYQSPLPAFGDWALVQLKDSGADSSSNQSAAGRILHNPVFWVGVVILVLAVLLLAIRTTRTRRSAAA